MAHFPFGDLQSFKDYVICVQTYLPDRFPPRTAVGPEDQWTLGPAFDGLNKYQGQSGVICNFPDFAVKYSRPIIRSGPF